MTSAHDDMSDMNFPFPVKKDSITSSSFTLKRLRSFDVDADFLLSSTLSASAENTKVNSREKQEHRHTINVDELLWSKQEPRHEAYPSAA